MLRPLCLQFGIFWTVGQICSATSRLLVHKDIAPAFFARLKLRAESIKVGSIPHGSQPCTCKP